MLAIRSSNSPRHGAIELNITSQLVCAEGRAFPAGQMIAAGDPDLGPAGFRYADASHCSESGGPVFKWDRLVNPTLLVEVLQADTQTRDRGSKWADYQAIDSLRDYLLVSQARAYVEHYQRTGVGDPWVTMAVEAGLVTLECGVTLSMGDIYHGVWGLPGDDL